MCDSVNGMRREVSSSTHRRGGGSLWGFFWGLRRQSRLDPRLLGVQPRVAGVEPEGRCPQGIPRRNRSRPLVSREVGDSEDVHRRGLLTSPTPEPRCGAISRSRAASSRPFLSPNPLPERIRRISPDRLASTSGFLLGESFPDERDDRSRAEDDVWCSGLLTLSSPFERRQPGSQVEPSLEQEAVSPTTRERGPAGILGTESEFVRAHARRSALLPPRRPVGCVGSYDHDARSKDLIDGHRDDDRTYFPGDRLDVRCRVRRRAPAEHLQCPEGRGRRQGDQDST